MLSLPKVGTPSASPKGSHTAAHTAKHGAFRMGWYHYPRSVPHVHKHPRAGYQNSKLCRFWVLAGCTPEGRRKPSGQRCAYACRCPEGVAAPLGCVICLQLGDVAVFSLCAQYFFPGSLSTIPCAVTFSANMQISLSVISVANSFALWYDKSHKSGLFGDEGEPE